MIKRHTQAFTGAASQLRIADNHLETRLGVFLKLNITQPRTSHRKGMIMDK